MTKTFRLIAADDLDTLMPSRLIPGTHLIQGGLNVIFGPPGTYKSFYALAIALHAAQAGSVIYIAPEGSSGFAVRKNSWRAHHNLPSGDLRFICEEINLLDAAEVQELANALKSVGEKIELIVFDTYARCLVGGDENSAKDAGLAVRACAYLQRRFSAAVALVHHTNSSESRERGSTALRGAADSMIEISAQDGLVRVDCSKIKDHPAWPTEYHRFLPLGKSGLLVPAGSIPESGALGPLEIRVLEFLTLEVFEDCGAKSQQIVRGLNLGESTIYKLLSRLKRNSLVQQDKKGDPYSITPIGQLLLEAQLSDSALSVKSAQESEIKNELSDSTRTIQ